MYLYVYLHKAEDKLIDFALSGKNVICNYFLIVICKSRKEYSEVLKFIHFQNAMIISGSR